MSNEMKLMRKGIISATVLSAILSSFIFVPSAHALEQSVSVKVLAQPKFLRSLVGKTEAEARSIIAQHSGYATRILSTDGRYHSQAIILAKNASHVVFLTIDKGLVVHANLASDVVK